MARARGRLAVAVTVLAVTAAVTGCQTGCARFDASINGSAQGAPTARAAREEWFAQDRAARGDAGAEQWRLETIELPGHGWFVVGGATCR